MIRRLLLFVFVLFAVGEAIVRFDEKTLFFQGDRGEIIANVYKDSKEKAQADRREFPHGASDLRVMLLGDSKLYGVGVRPEHSTGAVLVSNLRRDLQRDNVHLLDITIPGSNTFQNKVAFDDYLDLFAPQVVILAYNHNDVYGDQRPRESAATSRNDAPAPARGDAASLDRFTRLGAAARDLLFNFRVLSLLLVRTNMELKLAGVVMPGTEFYHLLNRSHGPDYSGWVESQKHLAEMADQCRTRGIVLIAYIEPELEMLPRYSVFDRLDRYLLEYFRGLGVAAANGIEPFRERQNGNFALSRYDGHPNEEAHEIMASHLSSIVVRMLGGAFVEREVER